MSTKYCCHYSSIDTGRMSVHRKEKRKSQIIKKKFHSNAFVSSDSSLVSPSSPRTPTSPFGPTATNMPFKGLHLFGIDDGIFSY